MTRVSGSNPYVADNSQTVVRFISFRRCDSQGNLIGLNQVANRPASLSAPLRHVPVRPSAPALSYDELRERFSSARRVTNVPMAVPLQAGRAASCDQSTQTDVAWEAPPPYAELDATPRPAASGRSHNNAL